MAKLTLIRGIPGSGKSTIAKDLQTLTECAWFEADHYFYNESGDYNFNINNLHDAHEWCRSSTKKALFNDCDVIVSNTFTTIKELKPYFEMCLELDIGYPSVITMQNNFGSIHGVPDATLDAMKKRFTYDLSPLYK